MMKVVKKILCAVSISLALALTGAASTQGFGQDKKAPERPKEKDKPEPSKDKDDKKNDDKKGGDKKKP